MNVARGCRFASTQFTRRATGSATGPTPATAKIVKTGAADDRSSSVCRANGATKGEFGGNGCIGQLGVRALSTSSVLHNASPDDDDDDDRTDPRGKQKQKVAKVIHFHNPIQAFANWIRLFVLKNNWDPQFSSKEFMDGARQAIILVSCLVAKGDFKTLADDGLLSKKAVENVRAETSRLNLAAKSVLQLSDDDIHVSLVQKVNLHSIVEIRHADIDVLFVGAKFKDPEKMDDHPFGTGKGMFAGAVLIYISTRFHREYTQGCIPSWTITNVSYKFS